MIATSLLVVVGVNLATSVLGSLLAVLAALHWDFEGMWQERRLRTGERLEARQRAREGTAPTPPAHRCGHECALPVARDVYHDEDPLPDDLFSRARL